MPFARVKWSTNLSNAFTVSVSVQDVSQMETFEWVEFPCTNSSSLLSQLTSLYELAPCTLVIHLRNVILSWFGRKCSKQFFNLHIISQWIRLGSFEGGQRLLLCWSAVCIPNLDYFVFPLPRGTNFVNLHRILKLMYFNTGIFANFVMS